MLETNLFNIKCKLIRAIERKKEDCHFVLTFDDCLLNNFVFHKQIGVRTVDNNLGDRLVVDSDLV